MDAPDVPGVPALLHNLVTFGRLLRAVGLNVTSGDLIEFTQSLEYIDIRAKREFHDAASCILVKRHEDLPVFEQMFAAFWRAWDSEREVMSLTRLENDLSRQNPNRQQSAESLGSRSQRESQLLSRKNTNRSSRASDDESDEGQELETIIALYSATESLRSKDFSLLAHDELADAKRFLAEMRWSVTRRRSLRMRAARSGRRLDVRRSIRRNLRHGGELLDLARRSPKMKRRQLVVLCDISGSMDRYTRLLLHFVHSVESSVQRVEVFLFGTRLTRITHMLRTRDPDAAIAVVANQVHDWSGGTRIGESLRTFNRDWARRVMGHGAIVLVISDGWDRGDPGLLAAEMARLQRGSYRLIWLNPLLGSTNYRPLTQGIQAALPYVDDFLPAHNLATLETLAKLLNDVQQGRPTRKQTMSTVSYVQEAGA